MSGCLITVIPSCGSMSFHGDTYTSPSPEAVMETSLSHEESGQGEAEPGEIKLDALAPLTKRASVAMQLRCTRI